MSQIEILDIDTLLNDKQPIWVRNLTKPLGIIVIPFRVMGKTHREIIPKSRLPHNLSRSFPAEVLRSSIELREYISRGGIELVSSAVATQELASSAGQAELTRLRSRSSNLPQKPANETEEPESTPPMVHGRVAAICAAVNETTINVATAISELQPLLAELVESDFAYILAQCGASSTKLRAFASRNMALLQSGRSLDPSTTFSPEEEEVAPPAPKRMFPSEQPAAKLTAGSGESEAPAPPAAADPNIAGSAAAKPKKKKVLAKK